jgi:hypothetical protein
MWYYLIDYVPAEHGSAPALPKGIGFLLLAAPAFDPEWGLFEVDRELVVSDQVRAVPRYTEDALLSAMRYPPAVALARDAMSNEFDGQQPTDAEFCARYAECLREHMTLQPTAPYLFVKATADEPGYLTAGQFYWVLRYLRGSDTVAWVSSDYFVYHNAAADFDLSSEQADALLLPFPHAI